MCHVDHIGVIYAYITKYKNNKKARFDVRVFRGYSKSAKEFKDSFDNLGDAIEVVNARKGKMTQTPVKSQFGWHIIKVEDRRQQDVTDQLRERIARNAIHERKFQDELDIWLRKIRAEAYVDIKI